MLYKDTALFTLGSAHDFTGYHIYRVVLALRPLTFLPVTMCESHKTAQAQWGVLAVCISTAANDLVGMFFALTGTADM